MVTWAQAQRIIKQQLKTEKKPTAIRSIDWTPKPVQDRDTLSLTGVKFERCPSCGPRYALSPDGYCMKCNPNPDVRRKGQHRK